MGTDFGSILGSGGGESGKSKTTSATSESKITSGNISFGGPGGGLNPFTLLAMAATAGLLLLGGAAFLTRK